MPKYLMTYRGPKGYQPTEDSTPKWRAWFEDMGEHLVELGQPVRGAVALGTCSGETTDLGGYSVIEADSLEDAVTVAMGCPHLDIDGGVEVGELFAIQPAP